LAAGYLLFGQSDQTPVPAHAPDQAAEAEAPEGTASTWTCSMHPQIRQDEGGDCPLCGMDLTLQRETASDDPLTLEMTPEAVQLAQVATTVIGSTTAPAKSFILSGKIKADERLAASQVAHLPGRIEKLFVTYTGEAVQPGQQLATLYSPDWIRAQRELLEALRLGDDQADLVRAARKKLEYWKVPAAQIRSIEESGQIQSTYTILADAAGVVTHRKVAVGDYVAQGEVLFDIVGLNRVWVVFDAYETDLAAIQIGDRIEFRTPAIPKQTFSTKVSFIDPLINPDTRVAALRGERSNPGGLLKPEMFVRGELQVRGPSTDQLLVPKSAILWTGTRSVVYVQLPDSDIPSFQFREVTLGERIGDHYRVTSGLAAGEEVVTHGNFAIDAAAQLNNQASMMNQNVLVKDAAPAPHLPDHTASTPPAFKTQLVALARAYLTLKDALVATDPRQASLGATTLLEQLAKVDQNLVEGNARRYWLTQQKALRSHGQQISQKDEVAAQRQQFDFLSQALITTIKVFGITDDALYVQYCPMAFDNTGAEWLSDVEAIRNPYFGDQMLRCGLVQETITKDFRNPTAEPTPGASAQ
ncbi:MAG: efflux RND transporter periplasmic adaptor subunit, partial [Bacteroidota bacterium]